MLQIFAVAGLDGINGNAWDNTHLPVTNNKVLIAGVFAYWDDLYINGGGNYTQGMFYTVSESSTAGRRNTSIEWYANRYGDTTKIYRFTLTFFENRPNTFVLQYLISDEQGTGATIGYQCDNCTYSCRNLCYLANVLVCDSRKSEHLLRILV